MLQQITTYSFRDAIKEWAQLPVDDVAYIPAPELLAMPDEAFNNLIRQSEESRYDLGKWRNYENKWRHYLGLDTTAGKTILDFGCGTGLEARQFIQNNNVILADINQDAIAVAQRTVGTPAESCLITADYPFFNCGPYDIFYANGVLHHTPNFREILSRAVELLNPGGEVRLMLYSDKGWELAGADPVRYFDSVGNYADWYNREKLEQAVGDFMDVYFCEYITDDDRYLVTKMRPR